MNIFSPRQLKRIEVKPDNFNKTCFHIKHNTRFISYNETSIKWDSYHEIKYSGKIVNISSTVVLYECKIEDKINWIDKSELKFPQMNGVNA